jgi:hypothetical protein
MTHYHAHRVTQKVNISLFFKYLVNNAINLDYRDTPSFTTSSAILWYTLSTIGGNVPKLLAMAHCDGYIKRLEYKLLLLHLAPSVILRIFEKCLALNKNQETSHDDGDTE